MWCPCPCALTEDDGDEERGGEDAHGHEHAEQVGADQVEVSGEDLSRIGGG